MQNILQLLYSICNW